MTKTSQHNSRKGKKTSIQKLVLSKRFAPVVFMLIFAVIGGFYLVREALALYLNLVGS